MNKTLKTIVWIVVVALVIWGVVSVTQNDSTESLTDEPTKIGVSAPITGPAGWWGEFIRHGIEIALDDVSPSVRNSINIIWEDDKCNPNEGLSAIRKLIDADQVKYILGPICNEVSIATEQLFEDNNVISITTGLPNKEVADMGDNHFSFLPEISDLMNDLASYAYQINGSREVGILYLDDSYGYENYSYFKEYFEDLGGKVVAEESFSNESPDMRTQLTKIKAQSPDSILLVAYGPNLIVALSEMEKLGVDNIHKYGINSFESPTVLDEIPELAEGVVYPRPASSIKTEQVTNYGNKYIDKFGQENGVYSANVYDSLNILINGIKECGYDNVNCVKEYLYSLDNYNGANGDFSINDKGIGEYEKTMLKTVSNGSFTEIDY